MISFLVMTMVIAFLLTLLCIWGFAKTSLYQKHRDFFICSIITVIFAAYAFMNLGNFQSPQSVFQGSNSDSVVVDFGELRQIQRFQFMFGSNDEQSFSLEFSLDGEEWASPFYFDVWRVFAWHYMEFDGGFSRFARITAQTDGLHIMEMAFRDEHMDLLPVAVISGIGHELFDEQHLVPFQPIDFMHSAYFDEVYYPRTAYEFIHQMNPDEWTHPPLGKVIISWGIEVFGMTPFGWRFMSAVAGVALVPIIYLLALALFKESFWAGFATIIFAFDFMHFVQTRIATLDVFVVLFLTAMFYFMYKYSLGKSLVPLLFSGIFMGLAISTKWSGLYGAVGLAIMFFILIFRKYREHKESPVRTLAWCVVFFVVIPLIIYTASYIPYYNTGYLYPERGFFAAVLQNQFDMADFHMTFDAYHPYTSVWWQWVINWRPILYFDYILADGTSQAISSFGNPIVWWSGIFAALYAFYKAIERGFVPVFLTIGYISLLLPWIVTARETQFIYYYYPNVVFLALMITYAIKEAKIFGKLKHSRRIFAYAFAGVTLGLFLLFYPVLAGVPINPDFAERFLLWSFMRDWVLIIY